MSNNELIYIAAYKLKKLVKYDFLFIKLCKNNKVFLVKQLLKKDHINVNALDKNRRTCLLNACYNEQIDIIKLLLKQPFLNHTFKDKWGIDALDCAIWKKNKHIVSLLLNTRKFNIKKVRKNGIFKGHTYISIGKLRNFDISILLQ